MGGSMTVSRSAGLPLVLYLAPVSRRETEFASWPVAALALVVDPTTRTRVDPALVAAGLGLTTMETRVSVLLAQGRDIREIAATTGRRETTIRWHLRQIFSKHGISRQAQLVHAGAVAGPACRTPGAETRGDPAPFAESLALSATCLCNPSI